MPGVSWTLVVDGKQDTVPSPDSWSDSRLSTLTGVNNIDALLAGVEWVSGALTFSFPTQNSTWSTDPDTGYGPSTGQAEPWVDGYQGLFAVDKAAARIALAAWSEVANLQFTEVTDTAGNVGDIRFAYVADAIAEGAQAFAYYPDQAAYAGDVWFNVDASNFTDPWEPGSYEYMTVLHEIGHALGLKHPFEREDGNPALLPNARDTRSFTLMSYSAAPGDEGSVFNYEPTTPMLLDIAAMQALYGENTQANAGNTRYVFASGTLYHETIWDAGGIDSIVLSGTRAGQIDLRAGLYGSRVAAPVFVEDSLGQPQGRVDNVWIAFATRIENATGASGADHITGNAVRNALRGQGGDDLLSGLQGRDLMWGGAGRDQLVGGVGADRLAGGPGNDTLAGSGGADRFVFDAPADAANVDVVSDFVADVDVLVLDRSVFGQLPPGGTLAPEALRAGAGVTSAAEADDRLLYDRATGALYYDADGTGPIAPVRFATLGTATHPQIDAADFALVA